MVAINYYFGSWFRRHGCVVGSVGCPEISPSIYFPRVCPSTYELPSRRFWRCWKNEYGFSPLAHFGDLPSVVHFRLLYRVPFLQFSCPFSACMHMVTETSRVPASKFSSKSLCYPNFEIMYPVLACLSPKYCILAIFPPVFDTGYSTCIP
jgi:hypothetical protein